MSSSRLFSSILLLLLTLFSANANSTNLSAAEDEADEYDVKARVVRISLISGEVSLKRKGNHDWERARLNFPLVEGDTVSTDRESRLEIQIDARNFVRLAGNTTMEIVTLRDEGVALSVVEGTATIRLVKFDRQREYFEIDAPRTTMAAEKKGLYRIDVPPNGRVRLSVRDGGSARIYSDTSGFALRDGRTAELVIATDNTGDWEFVANAPIDVIDDWVKDRERYLAQRLRYDTQYYDEYVWGAEDLDAYGDWSYTGDYGWIWRPHTTVINIYSDWAPYRYGHWVWCPPYGWTWVGYEPWGWAPYHYGRWVYHGGFWAWCPRSAYFRNHSWWRPALVVFASFGDNYCWYPLGYHQRDPHSRYYNQPGRLTALRADELANLRRVNPVQLRAVTTANAKQIGTEDLRPRRADDALARRAIAAEPLRTGLPARPATVDSATRTEGAGGRPARVSLGEPSASTGAATRTPGVPLDDELRRSRVLNGREARPATPVVDTTTSGGGEVETRPTGAVTRPARAPRETLDRGDDSDRNPNSGTGASERPDRRPSVMPNNSSGDVARPTRSDPPANSDSGEKPMRGRERIEPARPERSESPAPTFESRPQRSEPPARVEAPQRSEAPPQRSEAPPQRNDPPPQRSEAPQRTESPRSEPRSEPPSRPSRPDNYEPPERPSRSESPRSEPSRSESPRSESPRSEPSRSESPRSEPSRSEPSRSEPSRSESPRSEPSRSEPSRSEPTRTESPRSSDPDTARPGKPDRPRR
jgi:hypothetical protein